MLHVRMAEPREPEALRREARGAAGGTVRMERRYDPEAAADFPSRAGPLVAFSGGALLLIVGAIAVAVVPFVGGIFLFMGLLIIASGFSRTVRIRSRRPRPPAPPRDGGLPTTRVPPSTA